jgi:membrane dipeptidase
MTRRNFLRIAPLAVSAAAAGGRVAGSPSSPDRPPVIDGLGEIHLDYPMSLIDDILASGMSAVHITLGNPGLQGPEAFEDLLKELAGMEEHIDRHRDWFLKATRAVDLDRARAEGRLAILFGTQNATPLGDRIERVDLLYRLGLRCLQLTYNKRNLLGDGCTERTDAGLSEFGLAVLERMNALGMLVDLSHCGRATTDDGILHSKKPVFISHSGCRAVFDHPRSKTDAQLKAMADGGGVIGIFQINPFIGPKERNDLNDYLKHVDHAVKVAGTDHVGIGSDREHRVIPDTDEERRKLEAELSVLGPRRAPVHWPYFISELNHPRRMETIASALGARGYPGADVDKILGGNFYRLFKEVIG